MHGVIPSFKPDYPPSAGWYCLRTTVPGIFDAWGDLAQRGFDVYLLLGTYIRPRRRYKKSILGPYVFVWSTPFGIGRAYAAKYVCRQYCLANFPHPIPESEIAQLWTREAAGEFVFENTLTAKKRERTILRSLQELAIFQTGAHYVES